MHRNTAALFFRKLRERIAQHQEQEMRQAFDGQVEIDESYFDGHRKGKRSRDVADKVAVFGLLKRGGKVYTQMIPDCKRDTLMPIIICARIYDYWPRIINPSPYLTTS